MNCEQQIGIIRSSLMALTIRSIDEDPQFYYMKCGNFDKDNVKISIKFNRFTSDEPLEITLEINNNVVFDHTVRTEQYKEAINAMLKKLNANISSLCFTKK